MMQTNLELLAQGPRIKVFVGEFGSGKTELAVNYSLQLKQLGHQTAVVDIDLVKPYFRTRENRSLLEERGVLVVAPNRKLAHADLPIMPEDLTRILYDEQYQVVMDVGGGESAIVLGQLNRKFGDDNVYDVALIWEYPRTSKEFARPIDLCLQSMALGPNAARAQESGGVEESMAGSAF